MGGSRREKPDATRTEHVIIQRRIEDSVMLPKKIDEFAHFGFVRRQFAGAFGDFNKPIAIACFLYFGKQKIENDKIEVLNFIGAAFDELTR